MLLNSRGRMISGNTTVLTSNKTWRSDMTPEWAHPWGLPFSTPILRRSPIYKGLSYISGTEMRQFIDSICSNTEKCNTRLTDYNNISNFPLINGDLKDNFIKSYFNQVNKWGVFQRIKIAFIELKKKSQWECSLNLFNNFNL